MLWFFGLHDMYLEALYKDKIKYFLEKKKEQSFLLSESLIFELMV